MTYHGLTITQISPIPGGINAKIGGFRGHPPPLGGKTEPSTDYSALWYIFFPKP